MVRKALMITVAGFCLAYPAMAATPTKPDTSTATVNSYTHAQAARALKAAADAGFGSTAIVDAQAGNFFMTANKNGNAYQLTVTPEGKVYPGTPVSK